MNNSQKIAAIQRILRKSGDWTGKIDGRPSTMLYKAIKVGISKSIAFNGSKSDVNNLAKAGIDMVADKTGKSIGKAMDSAAKKVGSDVTEAAPGVMAAMGASNKDGWPIGVGRDIDIVTNHVMSAKISKDKQSRASYMAVAKRLDKCAEIMKGKPSYDKWLDAAKQMRNRVYMSFGYTDDEVRSMTDAQAILDAYTEGSKVASAIEKSYPEAYSAIKYGMHNLELKYKEVTGKGSIGAAVAEVKNSIAKSVDPNEISGDMKTDMLADIYGPSI